MGQNVTWTNSALLTHYHQMMKTKSLSVQMKLTRPVMDTLSQNLIQSKLSTARNHVMSKNIPSTKSRNYWDNGEIRHGEWKEL